MAADRIIASGEDRRGWEFISARTGLPYQEGMWTICREVDGQIIGCFAYTDFVGTSCQIHMAGASPRWINKDLLWKAFRVPFEQWELSVLLGVIAESNDDSRRAAVKLGFEEFAIVPRAHRDGGLVFMQMYRENCRWLDLPRRKHG